MGDSENPRAAMTAPNAEAPRRAEVAADAVSPRHLHPAAPIRREQLFTVFFFGTLALVLYLLYDAFSVFLADFAWATVFAIVFYPVYRRLLIRVRRPWLAALLVTVLIFHLIAVPIAAFGGIVATQAQNFYSVVNDKIASGEMRGWVESLGSSRAARMVSRIAPKSMRDSVDLSDLGLRGVQTASQLILGQAGGFARNVFGFIAHFLFMLVILFFFLRDGRRLAISIRDTLPMEREHKDEIAEDLYETLSVVMQSMVVIALLQGCLTTLAFWAAGLPFLLLLGFLSVIASFVPAIGSTLVWAPVVAYLFVVGSWVSALGVLFWCVVVVSTVDNVVRPYVIGSRTDLPTVFLLFGILGALEAFGAIGLFVAPALIAVLLALLRIYRAEYPPE